MQIKNLFDDDSAVSPVIGVILMVAITVILAAVIGTFVLGLGSNVEASPTTQFSFDYDTSPSTTTVTITHDGGDSIDPDRLSVNGISGSDSWSVTNSQVRAGNSYGPTDVSGTADEVSVVWTAESGESSQTLATSQIPE